MDYTGSLLISVIIFLVSFYVSYFLIKKLQLRRKQLGMIDLFWQTTLVLGIVSATAGVRKHQSSWKYENSLSFITHWYLDIKSDLERYELEAKEKQQRAITYNWGNEGEYSYLINWYHDSRANFDRNETFVLQNLDVESWKRLNKEFESIKTTSIRYFDDANQNILSKMKLIDDEIQKTATYESDRLDTSIEFLLFLLGPWILSLVLGLRIAKTRYTTFVLQD